MPPLRGLWCCGSVRFYKDSAPAELALSGRHQNHFLILTVVGRCPRNLIPHYYFALQGRAKRTEVTLVGPWRSAFFSPFSEGVARALPSATMEAAFQAGVTSMPQRGIENLFCLSLHSPTD